MRRGGLPRRAPAGRRRAPCARPAAPRARGGCPSFRRGASMDADPAVAEDVAYFAVAAVEHFAGFELDAAAAFADRHTDARIAAARGWRRVVDGFAVHPD